MGALNPVFLALSIALVVAVVAAGVFAYKLHRAGVSNQALPGQVGLKAATMADDIEERLMAALAKWAAAHPATLNAQYFDRDDLMANIGRLPASFTQAIRLDGAVIRNGDSPGVDYKTMPNGNIVRQ